ncbi:sterol desaturase family protein [Alterisphingorhabdus coralli]|uniref:Sterol desaturase family protein n=1 Tax=Alterisphingorhabdus coralli TaxID=3071408 RepID=A0AA97F692_9SPHN|nr:sterol desaturase family protein [Parasphingorhabdus sp. SCSIO 66989]WOE75164.1 sterol desaturase family protein [Parasphingorhabdus sp. SCSIO 66989]
MIAADQPGLITCILAITALVLLLAERLIARRRLTDPLTKRWRTHLGFVVINLPIERGVQALMAILLYGGISALGSGQFGLLPFLGLPVWVEWLLAVLLLDLAVWVQHVVLHHVPWLWRLHKVHHADRDFDMTTALRFHPLEIGLSMAYKMLVAFLLGVPLGALILFELLLSLFPLFNHANITLPKTLDRALRWLVVTPDMHRIHHSTLPEETHSNYGFCFALWDRIFGTYIAEPRGGHKAMTIGLDEWQDDKPRRFGWSLKLPFR